MFLTRSWAELEKELVRSGMGTRRLVRLSVPWGPDEMSSLTDSLGIYVREFPQASAKGLVGELRRNPGFRVVRLDDQRGVVGPWRDVEPALHRALAESVLEA